MSNGYTGSDSANEAEAIHIEDSLALNRALRQINDNNSGDCEECGEPIPAARLAVVSNAKFCVHCQAVADKVRPGFVCRNTYVP
ncbi:DksA-like zinc-finger protein [Burkholderia phage Bm1]